MDKEPPKLYYEMSKLVLGCGNVLFGDDGFGPAVAGYLTEHYRFPDHIGVYDVGTSVRQILFDLVVGEVKPEMVVIIDAVDKDRTPGEIFEIELDEIPTVKLDDLSMHQMPSSNLLKELKEHSSINIRILVAQVEHIPAEVGPGLTEVMGAAVPEMAARVVAVLDDKGISEIFM